ncbi:MAG: S49 family peptidase, partial [Bacteroidales bacterium]|nr:S49 family peptidase [Bacteroidales bacterium]
DELAQGRVWSGSDAIMIGFADEIGTLEDAVAYAAAVVGLDKYKLATYPAKLSSTDKLLAMLSGESDNGTDALLEFISSDNLKSQLKSIIKMAKQSATNPVIMARMPYIYDIR